MTFVPKPLLIFIVGSTATGKTEFSLMAHHEIEKKTGAKCEVLNFDSVQVYRGIDIGTAKPTAAQLSQAPHHMISFVEKGETYTAGEYRRDALKILNERTKAGVTVFLVVGGSGFYAQALEKGMFELKPTDPKIRTLLDEELKEKGQLALFEELKKYDSEYAAQIAQQDTYRILRGLEIIRSQGKTLTQIRNEFAEKPSELRENFNVKKIGLRTERDELRVRIAWRTDRMLAEGWVEEVAQLRNEGLSEWSPMQSVGYKEIQAHLDKKLAQSELRDKIIMSTMQLAKRQVTWFKRDTEVQWFASQAGFSAGKDHLTQLLTRSAQ